MAIGAAGGDVPDARSTLVAVARSLDATADRIAAGDVLDVELPEIARDDDVAGLGRDRVALEPAPAE